MRTHRSARPFSRKYLTRAAAALFPGIWKVEMLALEAAPVGAAAERVSRGMTGVSGVVWRGGYEDTKAASRRQEGSGERAGTHPWGSGMDRRETEKLRARWQADRSVSRAVSVPTMCQVFVGVDRRGPGPPGQRSWKPQPGKFAGNGAIEHGKMGQVTQIQPPLCARQALPRQTRTYCFNLSTTLSRDYRWRAERLNNVPKATQRVTCRARI